MAWKVGGRDIGDCLSVDTHNLWSQFLAMVGKT